jgi:hypothetical protein
MKVSTDEVAIAERKAWKQAFGEWHCNTTATRHLSFSMTKALMPCGAGRAAQTNLQIDGTMSGAKSRKT